MKSSKSNIAHNVNRQHTVGKEGVTTTHHKFQFGINLIDYSVVRSKRLKTSEVIVDESGVVIRVPQDKPDLEIDNLLRRKGQWIIEKKRDYYDAKKQIKKPTFQVGSTLPYLGKNYRIEKDSNNSNEHLELRRGQFLVSGSNISDMYARWLMLKSNAIFRRKVLDYSKILNIQPSKTVIKENRWGSITKKGVLNLNVNLIKAPEEVIDYIIVHELCHFRIKKHSHHFWDFLRKVIPRYKESVVWLENNATSLIE